MTAPSAATERPKLTKPQWRALQFLATREYAAPSEIGAALGGTPYSKQQGLGRTGGAMAYRLIRMGLAADCSSRRDGFPAYTITAAGRRALATEPTDG